MKRAVLMVLAVIILCVPLLSCVKDEEDPSITAMKAEITTLKNTLTTNNNNLAALQTGVTEAKNNATAALNKANQVGTPDLSAYSTKATVPENFLNNLTQAQIDALKVKMGITTSSSPTQTPTNPTGVIGQITYSVDPVQQFYQFSTGATIKLRINNNKSESRYVRPQITITTYGGTTTGIAPSVKTCAVVSNSQGQSTVNFEGTAIPNTGAATQIIFTSYSGGISNGQYLLGSGNIMDIYVTITVVSSTSALWTMTFSGSDTSLTGT
jgi:hypothetical protein